MSEKFDINRFGKYFVTDFKNAWNNFGLSFILICSLPVATTLLCGLWSVILTSSHHWTSIPNAVRFGFYGCAMFVMLVTLCTKLYGHVTDKKQGTSFLMIPVSILEKTISMILVVLLVTAAFYLIYLGFDALVCLFDKGCGDSLLKTIVQVDGMAVEEINVSSFKSVLVWTSITQIINSFLVFLFGAIFFKKSKAAKTILSVFAIAAIFGSIFSVTVPSWINNIDQEMVLNNAHSLVWSGVVINLLLSIGMSVAIYFRLKTLKH